MKIKYMLVPVFMFLLCSAAITADTNDSASAGIVKISRITQNAVLNGDDVFLRDKPSVRGAVIKKLKISTVLTANEYIETSDKTYTYWYHVTVPESKTSGYIYARYVTDVNYSGDNSPIDNFFVGFNSTGIIIGAKKNAKIIGTAQIKTKVNHIDIISKSNFLFVAAYDTEDTGIDAVFCGIINTQSGKWAYRAPEKSMENPKMLFVSPSKVFAAIDSGSSSGARGLTVVNLENEKIAYETSYDSSAFINWDKKGLTFYRHEEDDPGMPEPKEGFFYSRKIVWDNGKETKLNEYIESSEE